MRIQTAEQDKIKPEQGQLSCLCATAAVQPEVTSGQREGEEKESRHRQKEEDQNKCLGRDVVKKRNERSRDDDNKREKAASVIQTKWREHRDRVSD